MTLGFFNKKEILAIAIIILLIFLASLNGYLNAGKRARDTQRKMDLGNISKALETYKVEFGSYPPSSRQGMIMACAGENSKTIFDQNKTTIKKWEFVESVECVWGKDSLADLNDADYPKYLEVIPADPQSEKGVSYLYFSSKEAYQLLASFENKDEEYLQEVEQMNIDCGTRICNTKRGFTQIPLEKLKK